jgi:outer membrane lipoprotein-sorting protein
MKVRLLAAAALLVLSVPQLLADPRADQWIAKARSAIGAEGMINQIRSIHFKGTLETTQKVPLESDPNSFRDEPLVLAIDIIFQKPYQQRMELRSERIVETTALDDSEAWFRRADATDDKKWQLSLLDVNQIRRLRANTWENLNFYSGIEKRGGKVEFGGDVTVDGKDCVKIVFSHAENIVFTRFFEKATGRLVKTETEGGGEIREEGDILVQGLRFPRKLINKAPNGVIATITFETVSLNEGFPKDLFAVPDMVLSN